MLRGEDHNAEHLSSPRPPCDGMREGGGAPSGPLLPRTFPLPPAEALEPLVIERESLSCQVRQQASPTQQGNKESDLLIYEGI